MFLVGEAAHVNPPWGGHGFNTSVGDAVNLAWKIAAVEHGWASAGLLATYEQERRGVVEQTVACAGANMRAMAGDLPADAAVIQEAKRAEFHSLGLVLGYSYAGSAAIQPAAGRAWRAVRDRRHHELYADGRAGRPAPARLAARREIAVRPARAWFHAAWSA